LDASVAQARKYGLGMMFATQAPKDNKIILNCTTQFYGKMGSETDAKTVKQLIHDKGGAADDIGKLPEASSIFRLRARCVRSRCARRYA
jgi:hypothetical protein